MYAWYEPKNYTLSFTCNGESGSQYGIQNLNLSYDTDLLEALPLGKIVNEDELIYSVSYGDLSLADLASKEKVLLNEATFRDSDIFASSSKIMLELKTLPISAKANLNEQEVCIHDDLSPFEQKFKDEYICDSLSLKKFDFELLEKFGYNTVFLEINCKVRERDEGTLLLSTSIPLSKLKSSDGIYIYYGASGFGEDDWYRVSTEIQLEFVSISSP